MRLIVFGASGRCGSHLVRLAADRAHQVTAVVRPTTSYDAPPGVRLVQGDVLDPAFVDEVIPGHDAVLSCLGIRYAHPWAPRESPDDFVSRATAHIVEAMMSAGVARVSVISAAGVGDSRPAANVVIRLLIAKSNVGIAYADLERVERILRESTLDWQAVRPTTLTDRRGKGRTQIAERFGVTASIPRSDVAAFMLHQIEQPQFCDRTPMITGS